MLCSPAVLAAQQLQEHSLEQQVQLAQAQQQGLALAAQCRGYEAQLERSKAKNQVCICFWVMPSLVALVC
jgi:hypothetical protein